MKDLTKKFEAPFGFVVVYGGTDRNNYRHTPYKLLARSPQDVIDAMQSWHSYGRADEQPIKPNEYFIHAMNAIFSIDDGSWQDRKLYMFDDAIRRVINGHEVDMTNLKTRGCGAWGISFYVAMAPTLEEHEAAYKAKCEAERQERIRIAKEEREQRMTEMYQVRRGWYSVMMTFSCYYWSNRRGEMLWGQKEFSGKVIANSQMDAYNKACHDIEVNSDPSECQGPEFPDPTNQSMFDAYFLGMKTDEGYSLAAWEEFSKTDEYKESVK